MNLDINIPEPNFVINVWIMSSFNKRIITLQKIKV